MPRIGVSALALLGLLALAAPASAHALLRQSDPAAGAVLDRSPEAVTITFTEQPEPTLSFIRVLNSTGGAVPEGPTEAVPGQPLDLRVSLRPLSKGLYTVSWRTVSRVDGHVTGGAFAFGVGITPSATTQPQSTTPPPSPGAVASKWGLYVGLSGLLGAAWVWSIVLRMPPSWGTRYLWIVWACAALGLVGFGAAQAADAGVGIARLLQSALGLALWGRALPILAAGIAIVGVQLSRPPRTPIALGIVGVSASAGMLAQVLAGHAGAGSGPWRWPNVADQWVHFSAVGAWIGGLAALLVAVRGAPDEDKAKAARRFSTGAGIAIGVVAITGVLRAIDEVGSWGALFSTDFGRLVLVKAGLLVVLAALGAINRYRSVPAAPGTLRGLRRVGGAELATAGLVLAVTGVLTGLPPSTLAQGGPAAPPPLVVSGSDFATSVRVRLEVAPGLPGPNQFIAHIADYDTGRSIAADRVTLRFTKPDRPDIGVSTLGLSRAAGGTYQGQGINLSLDGQWTIAAVIERGRESVEVPLALTARSLPQRIRTIEAPGQPTLYSIDLPGNRVLDLYLDPGHPGLNEVHATYIAAAGGELPVPEPAQFTVARSGSAPTALPVRRLGPGHFVADAQLAPGDWELNVTATATDGQVLRVRLTFHI